MWCNAITHKEEGGAGTERGRAFPEGKDETGSIYEQRTNKAAFGWLVGWLLRLDSVCSAATATGRERESERESVAHNWRRGKKNPFCAH